ncbi:hypothetical protein ABNG02_13755 [Halorubrum ejinorense]|uniref:Uncharacterized protein n=1 Tax=Halorubrum ejinorense TaxID=425309 RepID=A0AAV3SST1_9EURY
MTNAYTMILCCERIEDAISVGDSSALRHRLQEVADILADDQLEDPIYAELEKEAMNLVDRATDQDKLDAAIDIDSDGSKIPEELRRDMDAFTDRVARCYLRSSTSEHSTVSESSERELEAPTVDVDQPKDYTDIDDESGAWQARAGALINEQSPGSDTTGESDDADDTHQDGATEETTYNINNSVNVQINSDNSKNDYQG